MTDYDLNLYRAEIAFNVEKGRIKELFEEFESLIPSCFHDEIYDYVKNFDMFQLRRAEVLFRHLCHNKLVRFYITINHIFYCKSYIDKLLVFETLYETLRGLPIYQKLINEMGTLYTNIIKLLNYIIDVTNTVYQPIFDIFLVLRSSSSYNDCLYQQFNILLKHLMKRDDKYVEKVINEGYLLDIFDEILAYDERTHNSFEIESNYKFILYMCRYDIGRQQFSEHF